MPEAMSRAQALAVANRCRDAYSADRYASWPEVARILLRMGFDECETEAVMRSKITRWAADSYPNRYGNVPAKVVREYIKADEGRRGRLVRDEIAVWADEYRKEASV